MRGHWIGSDGTYTYESRDITRMVTRQDDGWRANVYVFGAKVHDSEHESRDEAIEEALAAGMRAYELRKFDVHAPTLAEKAR